MTTRVGIERASGFVAHIRDTEDTAMSQGRVTLALALAVGVVGSAQADVITIPQSALVPTRQLYTDQIGGGIGAIAVMTGGGNAANVGAADGRNDDGFRGPISLGFTSPLNFFGQTYTQFWANNNGNISFTSGISAYIPTGPIGADVPVMSVWFSDVDTRNSASGVMHIRQDIPEQIIITWPNVGRYMARGDQLNTFQLVLRSSDYDVPVGEGNIGFFWLDMPWEDTDTSTTAAIGFGDGSNLNAVVLQGTNTPGLNSVVAYHQLWFNPNLEPIPPTPAPEPGSLALLSLGLAGLGYLRRRRLS